MSEFTVIETQEQFDTIIGKRLERERETIRKEYENYLSPEDVAKKYEGYLSPDDIKKKYEGYLSPEEVAKKDQTIKAYETASVKTRVAHETGLSYDAISFLQGEDEEAIRKSAEMLKGLVGNNLAPLSTTEPVVTDDKKKKETEALRKTLKGLKGE